MPDCVGRGCRSKPPSMHQYTDLRQISGVTCITAAGALTLANQAEFNGPSTTDSFTFSSHCAKAADTFDSTRRIGTIRPDWLLRPVCSGREGSPTHWP